jgi:hypothetical protein
MIEGVASSFCLVWFLPLATTFDPKQGSSNAA